jgi:hypothetical protein
MRDLPEAIITVLRQFELAFSKRVWEWAKILLVGAILAPGKRTVTSLLRVMGLSQEYQFQTFHRVFNRDRWSSRQLSGILLHLLVRIFVPPDQPLVLGLDDHIERRRGAKIAAKGIYRDPVASSKSFFVKTSGLRWVCLMLLAPIPWAQRIWALPFLTVLAPSERYHQERKMPHKTLVDHARQMITQVQRWLPDRQIVVVADSSYAVLDLLAAAAALPRPVTMVSRLRLDAALYEPAPQREKGKKGAPRKKRAAAELGRTARRSGHRVGAPNRPLVWCDRARGRAGEWHSGVVSQRPIWRCANALRSRAIRRGRDHRRALHTVAGPLCGCPGRDPPARATCDAK